MSFTTSKKTYTWPYGPDNIFPFIDLKYQEKLIRPQLQNAFESVMDSGAYIMGPQVQELEDKLSEMTDTLAIGCASGTDALILALLTFDIKPGDAVFVPSFTFAATAETVKLLGATPVFVDCIKSTYCICPESLEEAYNLISNTSNLKPRAVIAVDLFGHPADYKKISSFCLNSNLLLIGDCAQSCGSTYNNRPVESLSDISTTSFYPPKPLGCYGDGGAVFLPKKNKHLEEKIKSLRIHGQGKSRYEHARVGITGRLDTLQAAFLLERLKIFPNEILRRRKVADTYTHKLQGLEEKGLVTPSLAPACESVWAQYTIQVNNRSAFQKYLMSFGIPSVIYYPIPLHKQVAYQEDLTPPNGLPITESLADHVVSLPINPYMKEEDQLFVIEKIRDFFL